MQRGRLKKRGSDEGEASTYSQQVLALGQLLKKPRADDKDIKQFRTNVTAHQRELKGFLQEKIEQAEKDDTRRRDELVLLITSAIQAPADRDTKTFSHTNIACNPIPEAANRMSAACKGLLAEYTAVEDMIADMAKDDKRLVTDAWTHDVEKTEQMLRLGHKTAIRNVKKVLGANEGDQVGATDAEEAEAVNEIKAAELNFELLKSLTYAERGVKRMVKGLSKDEIE